MYQITDFQASILVLNVNLWYHSFFCDPKKDSATALSWQLPVRPTERRTLWARAQRARILQSTSYRWICHPWGKLQRTLSEGLKQTACDMHAVCVAKNGQSATQRRNWVGIAPDQ